MLVKKRGFRKKTKRTERGLKILPPLSVLLSKKASLLCDYPQTKTGAGVFLSL